MRGALGAPHVFVLEVILTIAEIALDKVRKYATISVYQLVVLFFSCLKK